MTELYINNKLVDLPTDFKITLVTENVYFSKASTYTYDIELPMAPLTNNARIFGSLNRLDKTASTAAMPARLIVDNKVILDGTAIIVGVKENSISVQLLQGNSELNWKSKYEKIYIDELDLGNIGRFGFERYNGQVIPRRNLKATNGWWPWNCIKTHSNGNCVCTPITNKGTDETMNKVFYNDGQNYGIWLDDAEYNHFAAQPKLSYVLTQIFFQSGLTIAKNDLADSEWYQAAYIANSTEIWNIADLLPHWTLVELIDQLQYLFSCVIYVQNNKIYITRRGNFYNSQAADTQHVSNVLDEFQADIDQQSEVADADKSKAYDISIDDYGFRLFIGEDFDGVPMLKESELTSTPNENAFFIHYNGHKLAKPYKVQIPIPNPLDPGNPRYVTVISGEHIDHYRPSDSESSEKVTLKIIPAIPGDEELEWWDDIWPYSYGSEIVEDEDTIWQHLQDGTAPVKPTNLEKIPLAFLQKVGVTMEGVYNPPTTEYEILASRAESKNVWQGVYIYDTRHGLETYVTVTKNKSVFDMSLNRITNTDGSLIRNVYAEFSNTTKSILVSNTYVVSFVTQNIFDVRQQFCIKNQLYACKQIKYTITARGFDRIAEGEFYKL